MMKTVWIPGAVSATFKKIEIDPDGILKLLQECSLQAIEWSENLHVFPGDPEGAKVLYQKTVDAGIQVAAYGSYYRLGENQEPESAFLPSLVSAKALHAPLMRIWAGTKASRDVGSEERQKLAAEAAQIAEIAAREEIKIAFEWHKNTLTDENASAKQLLAEANHSNLYCLWQPTVALTPKERVEGIRMMSERLLNFHVYSWPDGKRGPLNAAEWQYYIDAAEEMGGRHCALLEFVRDDSLDQFRNDAHVLVNLLKKGDDNG